MRILVKLLAILVLSPIVLLMMLVLAIAAIIGLPPLWEWIVAGLTAPPPEDSSTR